MRKLFLFVIFILPYGCVISKENTEMVKRLPVAQLSVSLVDLIVRPEKIGGTGDDSVVQVSGFLAAYAIPYLFLTEDHAKANDVTSAISIGLNDSDVSLISSDCINQFVTLIGLFGKSRSGEYRLSNIQLVSTLTSGFGVVPCWQTK